MNDRLVFFFRRYNGFRDPEDGGEGYDQISVIAFSLRQARESLKELVINSDDWLYSHQINLDKSYLKIYD